MSKKSFGNPSRHELSEGVVRTDDELREKRLDLERESGDILVTRETLEELEGAGSAEGASEVQEAVGRAETSATDLFEQDSGALEELNGEGEDRETELEQDCEAVGRDLERIMQARGKISVCGNERELGQAGDHAEGEKEFLEGILVRLEDAIRQSQTELATLRSQVRR